MGGSTRILSHIMRIPAYYFANTNNSFFAFAKQNIKQFPFPTTSSFLIAIKFSKLSLSPPLMQII